MSRYPFASTLRYPWIAFTCLLVSGIIVGCAHRPNGLFTSSKDSNRGLFSTITNRSGKKIPDVKPTKEDMKAESSPSKMLLVSGIESESTPKPKRRRIPIPGIFAEQPDSTDDEPKQDQEPKKRFILNLLDDESTEPSSKSAPGASSRRERDLSVDPFLNESFQEATESAKFPPSSKERLVPTEARREVMRLNLTESDQPSQAPLATGDSTGTPTAKPTQQNKFVNDFSSRLERLRSEVRSQASAEKVQREIRPDKLARQVTQEIQPDNESLPQKSLFREWAEGNQEGTADIGIANLHDSSQSLPSITPRGNVEGVASVSTIKELSSKPSRVEQNRTQFLNETKRQGDRTEVKKPLARNFVNPLSTIEVVESSDSSHHSSSTTSQPARIPNNEMIVDSSALEKKQTSRFNIPPMSSSTRAAIAREDVASNEPFQRHEVRFAESMPQSMLATPENHFGSNGHARPSNRSVANQGISLAVSPNAFRRENESQLPRSVEEDGPILGTSGVREERMPRLLVPELATTITPEQMDERVATLLPASLDDSEVFEERDESSPIALVGLIAVFLGLIAGGIWYTKRPVLR